MINNLGRALTIMARAECREIFMHADVSAWGAPSECHRDVSRGEAHRMRLARKQAESEARAPWRVIVKQARQRGMPVGSPKWQSFVGRVYDSAGYPF